MSTPLSWQIELAGDGSLLKCTAIPSPSVSYEIVPIYNAPLLAQQAVISAYHVNRIIQQGSGTFGWPLETAAKDMDTAKTSAQTDWDGIHG
jgi:hypothetical protein